MKLKTIWKTKKAKKSYLDELITSKKMQPISYSKNENHRLGQFLIHDIFGLGFIQQVINQQKINVFFKDSERILLQNWL